MTVLHELVSSLNLRLTLCFLLLGGGSVSSQESIYSLSTGTFFVHGSVSAARFDAPDSTGTIDALFLPVRATYFSGSREWGGLVVSVETQILSFSAQIAGTGDGEVSLFYHRKGSLGYEFYGRIADTLLYRAGPVVSITLSQGGYRSGSVASGSLLQMEPLLGADGEIEFFPFNTDYGLVNGMHFLLGLTAEIGLSHFNTVLVSPHAGVGYIL